MTAAVAHGRLGAVTDSMAHPGQPVTVLRDGRLRAAGLRWADVVAYDWGSEKQGQRYIQRSFVLLDDGIQINQPVLFPPEQRGWW
ncbi:hypothetical protein ACWEF9_32550 [Streptomyces sp. NPDC004980]